MAIDNAEKRRSASQIITGLFGPGVTPNASPDQEWRQQVGWGYSGIAVGAPINGGLEAVLERYVPTDITVEYDAAVIMDELRRIRIALDNIMDGYCEIQHSEPARLRDGMTVCADGVDWDPGSGAGKYEYVAGSWVKL